MYLVYLDTNVFLDILTDSPNAPMIRALLRELKRDKARIYTSIITVQEVSVLSFRAKRFNDDNHAVVAKLARIQTITKEIAIAAARLEAQAIDATPERDIVENRRRKWDCFHIATGTVLGCTTLYSNDQKMLAKERSLKIVGIRFLEPMPSTIDMFDQQSRIQ